MYCVARELVALIFVGPFWLCSFVVVVAVRFCILPAE